MPITDTKVYFCKFCGKRMEVPGWSNTSRLINHLYDFHPSKIDQLKNVYLSKVIEEAYETKGEAK